MLQLDNKCKLFVEPLVFFFLSSDGSRALEMGSVVGVVVPDVQLV